MAETIVQRDSEIEQMTNERNGEGLKHGMRVFVCSNQTVPKLTISHHLKEKKRRTWLGTGWLLNTHSLYRERPTEQEHLLTLWFCSDFVKRNRQLETQNVKLEQRLTECQDKLEMSSKKIIEKSDFDIEEFKVS